MSDLIYRTHLYKIARSICLCISGKASEEEQKEVKRWCEENEHHREMFGDFGNEDYMAVQRFEHEVVDHEKAYRRFVSARRLIDARNFSKRMTRLVVVCLLLLCAGTGGWWFFREDTGSSVAEADTSRVVPGKRKAVLLLGNGEAVDLKDSLRVELVENQPRFLNAGDSTMLVAENVEARHALHTVFTPEGGEYNLVLPDGTRVWLNASSRLRFPAVFHKDHREVQVEGEVYFEVARDTSRPFLVRSGDIVVRVLGTSFNVRAYPEEEYKTTLTEGHVAVTYQGETMQLEPGQQWVLGDDGPRVQEVRLKSVMGWRNGDFAFDDRPLPDVFDELERWYAIRVFIENKEINDIKFTGIFPRYDDLNKVLRMIGLATNTKCVLDRKTVIVRVEK